MAPVESDTDCDQAGGAMHAGRPPENARGKRAANQVHARDRTPIIALRVHLRVLGRVSFHASVNFVIQ